MRTGADYYGNRVDIWCCGVSILVWIVIDFRHLLRHDSLSWFKLGSGASFELATGRRIREVPELAAVISSFTDDCWDLIQCMLCLDPLERPDAAAALGHRWF